MHAIVLVSIFSLALLGVNARAADDPVVGKWKFNPSKSQLTGLLHKIEAASDGKYRFIFGSEVETVTLDGRECILKSGDTRSIRPTGLNRWEVVTKRDNTVSAKANWSLSKDGKTLTSIEENFRPDGSTGRTKTVYKRTGDSSGIVGAWQSTSVKIRNPLSIEVSTWKRDGYTILNPAYQKRLDFRLNGKEYAPKGPRVAKGSTVSATRMDSHAMELTHKVSGKITQIERWELSPDKKSLTQTVTFPGVAKPEVDYFDRK